MKNIEGFTYENISFVRGKKFVVYDEDTGRAVSFNPTIAFLLSGRLEIYRKKRKMGMARLLKTIRNCYHCGDVLIGTYHKKSCGKRQCILARKRFVSKQEYARKHPIESPYTRKPAF